MTKQNLLEKYLNWMGAPCGDLQDLSAVPFIDRDFYEDETTVVNRLYFVAPRFDGARLRCFFFHEENFFRKNEVGDLELVQTQYHQDHGPDSPVP